MEKGARGGRLHLTGVIFVETGVSMITEEVFDVREPKDIICKQWGRGTWIDGHLVGIIYLT